MSSETKVSQGTKGAWGRSVILEAADRYSVMINIDGEIRPAFRMSVARPADEARYAEAEARLEADAALVAEAGTVLHETGMTPRELAEQNRKLRVLLAGACSGVNLYSDDGELQDNSTLPYIDFLRMSPTELGAAFYERAKARIALARNETE